MSEADYPGAIWIPAAAGNQRPGNKRKVERIVLHCTDGQASARVAAAEWQKKLAVPRSAHFAIGQDAEIVQAVRLVDIAYHAHTANGASVGVEHCCRTPRELGPKDPGLPPSLALLEAGAALVAWLCGRLGLEPSRATIVGHAEADPKTTHTGCPTSAGIDLDAYVARVVSRRCF